MHDSMGLRLSIQHFMRFSARFKHFSVFQFSVTSIKSIIGCKLRSMAKPGVERASSVSTEKLAR
jgi:hypothetical protein